MTERSAKSNKAMSLRASKAFQEFHQEVMDQQSAVFLNADATPDEIAEAHAMVRALRKLIARMDSAVFDYKLEQKREQKGQHRGSD